MTINALLATRIRHLRQHHGYTLDTLAELSGVSRSMISLIEREKTSPTAAVLNKLADALGVTLASLFAEAPQNGPDQQLSRHGAQQIWQDPASGYIRRHLSPSRHSSPIELVEVIFPAGKSVTFERAIGHGLIHQQIWMLEGALEITLEAQTWHLDTGDCLALALGAYIAFRNPGDQPARYVIALTPQSRRQKHHDE